jgi:hypothetical protein
LGVTRLPQTLDDGDRRKVHLSSVVSGPRNDEDRALQEHGGANIQPVKNAIAIVEPYPKSVIGNGELHPNSRYPPSEIPAMSTP